MYLEREGGRERERERAWRGVQWRVCEVDTFGNIVEKGVVQLRELEIKTWRERMNVCRKPIAS